MNDGFYDSTDSESIAFTLRIVLMALPVHLETSLSERSLPSAREIARFLGFERNASTLLARSVFHGQTLACCGLHSRRIDRDLFFYA